MAVREYRTNPGKYWLRKQHPDAMIIRVHSNPGGATVFDTQSDAFGHWSAACVAASGDKLLWQNPALGGKYNVG